MATFVFLDANVFVHYKDFESIDWCAQVRARPVVVVVPPVTVRELNKLKDTPSTRKARERAARAIRVLNRLSGSGNEVDLRDGVRLALEPRDPAIDFEAHQLVREVQDDQLIASMLVCRAEHPDDEVVLVTSDTGLVLLGKARTEQFRVVSLDDSLKLPVEVDPVEAENRQLRQQLAEVTARLPRLCLEFPNEEDRAEFVVGPPRPIDPANVAQALEQARERSPRMTWSPVKRPPQEGPGAAFAALLAASPEKQVQAMWKDTIARYNERLEKYFEELETYLQGQAALDELKARTIRLDVWLANVGTEPGKDIDIFMHFPDGFELWSEKEFPEPQKAPEPPRRPTSPLSELFPAGEMLRAGGEPTVSMPGLGRTFERPNVSRPSITRRRSYEVQVHVGSVKHGMRVPLDSLFVVFESAESAHSFAIDYDMRAANVPKPTTGELRVVAKIAPGGEEEEAGGE